MLRIPQVRFFNKFLNSREGLAVLRLPRDTPDRFAYKVLFHMNFPCRWVYCVKSKYFFRLYPYPRLDVAKRPIFSSLRTFTAAAITILTNWI